MRNYKNYIFDLYGTLLDIETNENSASLWKKMAALYSVYGADYTPASLKKSYLAMVRQEEAAIGGDYPEIRLETVFKRLYDEAPARHESELVPQTGFVPFMANAFRIISRKKCRVYRNTIPVLENLKAKGSGIYLLSNAQRIFTMPEIEKAGLKGYFDGIYISSDKGIRKPDTRFMQSLLDEYHLNKNDCVMVGNDYDADIGTAASVGMDSIYLNTYALSEEEMRRRLAAMRQRTGRQNYSPVLIVKSGDIGEILASF